MEGLKGDKGDTGAKGEDGKSAYDIWKEKPENAGKTEEDFLNSLHGKDGTGADIDAGDNISVNKNDPKKTIVSLKEDISLKSVNAEAYKVDGKTYIDKDGIHANGQKITHVADGAITKESTDAVNGSQLYAVDQRVYTLGRDLNNLRDESREGDALGAALAALKPIQYDPYERSQLMAGVGRYKSKNAMALGMAYYTNEHTLFHAGVAFSGSHSAMLNAGVTWRFGHSAEKDKLPKRYKEGPLTSVYVMQEEITELRAENAAANKRIDELEKLVQQLLNR